jgi:hypothetical protein
MAPSPPTSKPADDLTVGPGFSPGPSPLLNQPAPASRGTGFTAVEPRADTESSALPSLVAAYVLMWLLLLGFVWLVARRQARTEAGLAELERAIRQPPRTP